uniref:Hypothetical secreted peptide n=1 Tax=Glossina morsitans morsitans TaxID=37546 RepID=D3TSK8_GLOMM
MEFSITPLGSFSILQMLFFMTVCPIFGEISVLYPIYVVQEYGQFVRMYATARKI